MSLQGAGIGEIGMGRVIADTLSTSSVGGTTLNGPSRVSNFNATNTTAGDIALRSGPVTYDHRYQSKRQRQRYRVRKRHFDDHRDRQQRDQWQNSASASGTESIGAAVAELAPTRVGPAR